MILIDTIILTIICVITELHILYATIGIATTKRITQTKYICKGVRQKPFLYSILCHRLQFLLLIREVKSKKQM